jgi:NAD(P)-dependent dehydrogenase (short-subunit alcohol dehydrogenase family)
VSAPIPSIKASPRAIRAAAAAGVDLSQVRGTGKSGRIREKDVLAAQGAARPAPTAVGTRFSLQGKVTLVTGAGSGIGAAIAEAFVRAGALVYVADINAEAAQAQVRRLAGGPGVAKATALDVSDGPACEKLVKQILVSNGRCDVLVNNAGVGHVGTVLTTSPSDLERLWAVNVRGMYQLCRAVLPSMVERRSGSIINLASVIGLTAMEDRFAYTVTKHAVVGLTRSIALDFGTTGVRVNCICPGRVETPFVEARLREYPDPEKYRAQMVAPHALKRMAQPWEIASAALYLASDDSAFVTGSTLVVDGGYLCGK